MSATRARPSRIRPPLVIVSGGQTGADRAALDAALALGLAIGGWCPRGRWAEDGPIAARYTLCETDGADPSERTRANVRDADATLVLTLGATDAGTELTLEAARAAAKPCVAIDLTRADAEASVRAWLSAVRPSRLNVAGPRESAAPGLYARAREVLATALIEWSRERRPRRRS